MLYKKAFTLAEILIVLMVIGVIATMTIPSMMKGVQEAQYKSGYKKALNTIANLTAAERVGGMLPSTNLSSETLRYFQAMNSNLSVNGYVDYKDHKANSGYVLATSDYSGAITIDGQTYGPVQGEVIPGNINANYITTFNASPWIVTDDNMAYSVMCGGETGVPARCATVLEINGQPNQQEAIKKSCSIVLVDVNGLSKGPNKYDPQLGPDSGVRINTYTTNLTANQPLKTLVGDQYIIFIGSDGATAGPKATTVTGRIAADLR